MRKTRADLSFLLRALLLPLALAVLTPDLARACADQTCRGPFICDQFSNLGFACASLDDMQQRIDSLAASAELWSATSARCRRYMDARFGEDRILAPYLRMFAELAP